MRKVDKIEIIIIGFGRQWKQCYSCSTLWASLIAMSVYPIRFTRQVHAVKSDCQSQWWNKNQTKQWACWKKSNAKRLSLHISVFNGSLSLSFLLSFSLFSLSLSLFLQRRANMTLIGLECSVQFEWFTKGSCQLLAYNEAYFTKSMQIELKYFSPLPCRPTSPYIRYNYGYLTSNSHGMVLD